MSKQEQFVYYEQRSGKPEPVSFDDRERVSKEVETFNGLPEVTGNIAQLPYFIRRYEQEGQNLSALYSAAETRSGTTIAAKSFAMGQDFMNSREHGEFAQFIELLPLLANKKGRLGPFLNARVTKTAKPDDAGASFVDLVVELKNDYLKTEEAGKDRFLRNVRPSASFAVDVTYDPNAFEKKVQDFQKHELKAKGDKAHVFAYEQEFPGGIKRLGIDTLKCIVFRDERYLADIAKRFRSALAPSSQGGFIIADEKYFDKVYREFFGGFITSVKENTLQSLAFLESLPSLTPKQKDLKIAYQSLANFLEAYEKTPNS